MPARKLFRILIRPARNNSVRSGTVDAGQCLQLIFRRTINIERAPRFESLYDSLRNRLSVARCGRRRLCGLLANLVRTWAGGSTTAKRDQAECCNDDPFHPELDAANRSTDVRRLRFFLSTKPIAFPSYTLGDSRSRSPSRSWDVQDHPLVRDAKMIGEVVSEHSGMVRVQTRVGGTRVLDVTFDEQLPRIC